MCLKLKNENFYFPANMSDIKKSTSRRTVRYIFFASFIEDFVFPFLLFCSYCLEHNLVYYSFNDNRCSRCVRSGVEGHYNAKMDPRFRRTLKK